jgi:hypothetical protein
LVQQLDPLLLHPGSLLGSLGQRAWGGASSYCRAFALLPRGLQSHPSSDLDEQM